MLGPRRATPPFGADVTSDVCRHRRRFVSEGYDVKQVMASVRSGNWKALLACFLYFDTGFTTWVMFGPLAPFISKQLTLSPTQAGFLVAVPVLAASIVRVTLGNLFQSVSGRKLALISISLSAVSAFVLLLPVTPTYTLLLVLGV